MFSFGFLSRQSSLTSFSFAIARRYYRHTGLGKAAKGPVKSRHKYQAKKSLYISDPKSNAEHLTKENASFVAQRIIANFAPAVESRSPLKFDRVAMTADHAEPWKRGEWEEFGPDTMRTGLIAVHLGRQLMWDVKGKPMWTTALHVLDNHVVDYISPEELAAKADWRAAVWGPTIGAQVVGAKSVMPFRFTDEALEVFQKCGLPPKLYCATFPVTSNAIVQPGTPLIATHFRVGDSVNIRGRSTDHGFQGVIRRHGFRGGPATHGASKFHRRPGATGGGRTWQTVIKGHRGPGHMGFRQVALINRLIVRINPVENVIYINGFVQGQVGNFLRIQDTNSWHHRVKMVPPPCPTHYIGDEIPPQNVEMAPRVDDPKFLRTSDHDLYHPSLRPFYMSSLTFAVEEVKSKKSGRGKAGKKK